MFLPMQLLVTDACAQKAIELITKYLRTAVHEGKNVEARENMAYAEYFGRYGIQ